MKASVLRIWTELMEKNCDIFVIKMLYFVNILDFKWTCIFNFLTFFWTMVGLGLD